MCRKENFVNINKHVGWNNHVGRTKGRGSEMTRGLADQNKPVPRATVAYGRQLKILPDRPDVHGLRIPAWFGTNADLHKSIIKAAIKIRAALSPIAVVK